MNSTVFAVAVVSAVVGAIFGVLVKHILDMRGYDQVCRWYVEESEKVDEMDKVISGLQKQINRLTEENNRLQIERNMFDVTHFKASAPIKGVKIINPEEVRKFFIDMARVEPLPDHFNDDIDFGGKF